MGNIVICGDSFSVGIGCPDLHTQPFGVLLSRKLGKPLINFAKGSSTNLSIFLQVKYAIENVKDIDWLGIGVTSYNRIEWFPENAKNTGELNNTNVNYHQYPPYGNLTYHQLLENPMKDDPKYTGEMLTENWIGVIDYVENFLDKDVDVSRVDYFKKFQTENNDKMRLLKNYFFNFFDERIQRQYDRGVIIMAHLLLKKNNINHHILTWDQEFKNYIPEENLINVNWGELSLKYPDPMKTLHTSPEGHKEVYRAIMKALNKDPREII